MSSTSSDASVTRDPETERLLDTAEIALDNGDPESAIDVCERILSLVPTHTGALFVAAEAYRNLGVFEVAERHYREVTRLDPEHSPSWSGLAASLFDQVRIREAHAPALRAIRLDTGNPEGWYVRGMIRERRGDLRGAERDFHRAATLDPDAWPRPQRLSDAMVEAIVEEALLWMHASIRAYLSQVAILLEEVPDDSVCLDFDPPAPPGELLGYYSGAPLTERSLEDPWSALPSAIVLFRRNLERIAWDRERLVEELQITVFHEVGHFLGLDEEDLEARGLE
jgi:predicted Zn-dependent protease with MMP-like domain